MTLITARDYPGSNLLPAVSGDLSEEVATSRSRDYALRGDVVD